MRSPSLPKVILSLVAKRDFDHSIVYTIVGSALLSLNRQYRNQVVRGTAYDRALIMHLDDGPHGRILRMLSRHQIEANNLLVLSDISRPAEHQFPFGIDARNMDQHQTVLAHRSDFQSEAVSYTHLRA